MMPLPPPRWRDGPRDPMSTGEDSVTNLPPGIGPVLGTVCILAGVCGAGAALWKARRESAPRSVLRRFLRKTALLGKALAARAALAVGGVLRRVPWPGQVGALLLLSGVVGCGRAAAANQP